MNDLVQDAEEELHRLLNLLSLLEMAACTLPTEHKGPMTTGLAMAITSVIDLQNRLAEMEGGSGADS